LNAAHSNYQKMEDHLQFVSFSLFRLKNLH